MLVQIEQNCPSFWETGVEEGVAYQHAFHQTNILLHQLDQVVLISSGLQTSLDVTAPVGQEVEVEVEVERRIGRDSELALDQDLMLEQ